MHRLAIKEGLDKKFKKLRKKDPELLLTNLLHFKPLKKPLQNKRRVHIGGSFVLIYEIDEKGKMVTLLEFDHHDNIYKM
ncbi:MAG: type II toxin-antitoxin system RelE/ParE family toxin [Deltaproteobacteria bacterium]